MWKMIAQWEGVDGVDAGWTEESVGKGSDWKPAKVRGEKLIASSEALTVEQTSISTYRADSSEFLSAQLIGSTW